MELSKITLTYEQCDNGDGTATIPLLDRYGVKYAETIIDIDDLQRVLDYTTHWSGVGKNSGTYVASRKGAGKTKTIYLHRFINNTPEGLLTDHIDGDPLNNRKSNLRSVTAQENQHNRRVNKNSTSGYRGVSKTKRNLSKPWYARAWVDYKAITLGHFATAEEANEAVVAWRKENMPNSRI